MDYRLFDTHSHPQFPQYDTDRDRVIRHALRERIGMVCVGTDLESSQQAIALADRYEGMFASVGLHPNDALEAEYDTEEADRYHSLLSMHSAGRVVAVGEIGLDYYRTKDITLQQRQRKRFETQLGTAIEAGLPVIIHCREAHGDMKDILRSDDFRGKLTGVIHSFTGTWEDARHYLDLGYFIGLNGIITFARDYDETVKNVPLERVLLETDAPFLAPIPYRGKRNEPVYIIEVAQQLAELRGVGIEQVEKVTTSNALGMFIKQHNSKL